MTASVATLRRRIAAWRAMPLGNQAIGATRLINDIDETLALLPPKTAPKRPTLTHQQTMDCVLIGEDKSITRAEAAMEGMRRGLVVNNDTLKKVEEDISKMIVDDPNERQAHHNTALRRAIEVIRIRR